MVVHKQEQKFDAERAENRHFQHQLVPSKLHREENVNQKAFSLLITMRVSKRGNSYNHAKVSVAAIRSVFPKAKLLLFSDEYVPFLHNDIINHGDNWTKLVLGKRIPRHHNDSWKRIQWRTAICSDFMQIIEKIGDFEEDLLLWVEDDVIVKPQFHDIFYEKPLPFRWDILVASLKNFPNNKYVGSGFLAVAFKKYNLKEFLKLVKEWWTIDPLDWILARYGMEMATVKSVGRKYIQHMKTETTLGCRGPSSKC